MEGSHRISFRFTKDLFRLEIFDEFLAYHKVNVLSSSMGLHQEECATPHYHYHLVCSNTFPFKSPPVQAFKNKYKDLKKLFKENSNALSIKVTAFVELDDDEPDRFLNYTLKEKRPIPEFCRNINIEQSCLEAAAEWQAAKTWKAKLKARKLAEETKKGLLYAHLDKQDYSITGLHAVVRDTLTFYKGNKDAPHPCYQVKSAEIYAYHKGLWSLDAIIKRYLGEDPKTKIIGRLPLAQQFL